VRVMRHSFAVRGVRESRSVGVLNQNGPVEGSTW